jgi:hypothetical protein
MSKYKFSPEGVKDLRQLSKDLRTICGQIDSDGKKLSSKMTAISGNLGIYRDKILELVKSVQTTQDSGKADIEQLSKRISTKADEIESLLSSGS